jgi:hypothetical protein
MLKVAEHDVEPAPHEEGHQVDRRERPGPEEPEGDEWVGAAGHQERECDQCGQPDDDRCPRDRILPLVLAAADHAERQTADRERRDDRTEPVEPPGRVIPALCDVAHRDCERDGQDRHVDQEGDAPPDRIDKQAAQQGTDQRQGRCRRRPQAERAAALRSREGLGDDG